MNFWENANLGFMKKIVKYKIDGREGYGILNNSTINPVEGNIFGKHNVLNKRVKAGDVTLLPPVNPSKIVGVGLNYRDHADELNMPLPDEPIIFIKPSTGVIGHKQNIIYPEMSVPIFVFNSFFVLNPIPNIIHLPLKRFYNIK